MTDLLPWAPPDGVEVLIAWLSPLAECRSKRPTGAVLPFIRVVRTGGEESSFVDEGKYSIFTFAETEDGADALSKLVHRRIQLLASQFTGQQAVTISTGDVYADNVKIVEGPRPMDYLGDTIPAKIYMFTAIYEVHLRYQEVS